MLSKIKSAAAAAAAQETRTQASDNEETEIDNDTNNNNNNNNNNMNNNGKKNQDELLDIVEVSRKRRLSKGSADSLTGFIRWSFSHLDHPESIQLRHQPDGKFRQSPTKNSSDEQLEADDLDEEMLDDNIEDWPRQFSNNNNRSSFQVPDNTLPRKLSAAAPATGGGSSAANSALIKAAAGGQLANLGGLLTEVRANNKRPRSQVYSPDSSPSKFMSAGLNGSQRKTSSYLGNVVERLHHQQSLAQQLQQQQQQELSSQQDIDTESGPVSGLSFHLQQFLQQQTSLEDLCSSVNLVDQDNNQQQLALAAAIHRALVDSVGHNQVGAGLADAKSTASSTGSSNGTGSSSSTISQLNLSSQQVSALSAVATSANFTTHHHHQQQHQLDSAMDRQRRVYNTRAALHGLAQGVGPAHTGSRLNQHHHLHSNNNSINHLNSHQHHQNGLAAMNMSNRVQQQRHAQAAAALSALAASAGSHSHPLHLAAAAAAAAGATPTTPIVDFKCDTCPSSFDDRHRLMQHQSIHLELKKDWFTETPVDEVMKIFNRRRGEFLCNICNLRFEATLDYDQHNHSVHGPRPYCCQFCGNGTRTFKCWRQYLNHLYDHRYIFSCTIDDCDFTVNRRDSLRFHIFRFHLNCQLPQNSNNNQQSSQQQRSAHNSVPLMLGNGDPLANKWSSVMDDEDDDTENEMNVAD